MQKGKTSMSVDPARRPKVPGVLPGGSVEDPGVRPGPKAAAAPAAAPAEGRRRPFAPDDLTGVPRRRRDVVGGTLLAGRTWRDSPRMSLPGSRRSWRGALSGDASLLLQRIVWRQLMLTKGDLAPHAAVRR
jgi:hypothetical protein